MDRDVAAFCGGDVWRVAALSMMSAEELRAVFGGDDAAPWVVAAANGGIVEAQRRLGRMLLSGEGIAKDEAAAFAWFARAAETGDSDAHNMLGRCHENGWGTARDADRAARHYAIAACAGDAWAQYNLGHLFLGGIGVPRDRDEAFQWYSRAAGRGHVRAMNLVARCHEEGWGTARDAALARVWYRKSADGGYFRGAYNYATMLAAEGCIAGAAHWFEKALAAAPDPSRTNMTAALMKSPHAPLRALALGMTAQTGATEGLI
ncbi:MAG TPA: tetratricopeptide repeat protein [Rhizomicrobium sp.]|nr:tetratricopeptide repeat protein [Rhizomicrobium sp.]